MALDKITVTEDRVTGEVTLTPSATLDLSLVSGLAKMTLVANLASTLSNVPTGATVLRVIHGGYTLSIEGKTTWIDNGEGEYEVRVIKYDTGVIRVSDVNGGQGESVPSSLGAFSPTGITLSSSGYYDAATIAANTTLTFATTGHEEGKKRYVKLTFDGTDTFTAQAPQGVLVHTTGFTSGGTPTSGAYMLYMTVEAGAITVELKAIAVIVATVIVFSDDFTDNSFDLAVYESLSATPPYTNSNLPLAETGGKLTLTANASTGGIRVGAYKIDPISLASDLIIVQCDFVQPNSTNILGRFGLYSQKVNASPDIIAITGSATAAGTLRALSVDGSSTELNSESGVSATGELSIRISYIPSTGAFTEEYWNGSAWTSLGTGNVDMGANVYVVMLASSTGAFATPVTFDTLKVSNIAYSTQYPS